MTQWDKQLIHSMDLEFLILSILATTFSSPAIHAALTSQWHHLPSFCTERGSSKPTVQEVVTTQTAMEEGGAQYSQDGHDTHLFPRRLHWIHLS